MPRRRPRSATRSASGSTRARPTARSAPTSSAASAATSCCDRRPPESPAWCGRCRWSPSSARWPSSAGERTSGGTATGSIALAGNSTEARLAAARKLLGENKLLDAIKTYDAILSDHPDQPEALAYKGWLLHLAGLGDAALDPATKAVAADPTYPDAHFFRAEILCTDKHDGEGAVAEYRLFFANIPPQGFPAD